MKKYQLSFKSKKVRLLSAFLAFVMVFSSSAPLYADRFDDMIRQRQEEANQLGVKAQDLRIHGDTLQAAVNNLNAQIAELEGRIAENQKKLTKLKADITKAEADIAQRNEALAANLKMMYHEGEVSNLEKVASSKSISDFVDKQEGRNRLQARIKTALGEIKELKKKLEEQKKQVDQLIKQDEVLRNQIANQRAEQARLLEQTRGEEAAYQQQISAKRAEITSLQAQQRAALNRATGGRSAGVIGSFQYRNVVNGGACGGGYPAKYCLPGHDAMVDEWDLYNRECVSYAAWAADYKFGRTVYPFNGNGHAYQWQWYANPAVVNDTPAVGAIAMIPRSSSFPLGHVMVVEAILPDGWLHVSQYNWAPVIGTYSEMDIRTSGVKFIHFQ